MNTTDVIYLSKKGIKELKKQISSLEKQQHEALNELRELDKVDSHEERLTRIEKLANLEIIETDLAEKKTTLASAKQLPRKRDALIVALGSVVDLIDTSGRVVRYTIVDSLEANPSDGRISVKSPLGQSLIGRRLQDVVEWSAGIRTNQLQLIHIA